MNSDDGIGSRFKRDRTAKMHQQLTSRHTRPEGNPAIESGAFTRTNTTRKTTRLTTTRHTQPSTKRPASQPHPPSAERLPSSSISGDLVEALELSRIIQQEREIIGIGEMVASKKLIITHGLGSCVALVLWDSQFAVGAMIHIMLPDSSLNPARAKESPTTFADLGVPLLLEAFQRQGGNLHHAYCAIIGGASSYGSQDLFNIGKRNAITTRKLLWNKQIQINYEECGGTDSRTVMIEPTTGCLYIKVPQKGTRRISWM